MMNAEEKAAWLNARAGKLTASRMADAMAFLKNGQPAGARIKLLHELLAERLTGESVRHVVTDAMLWGMEHEDEAVDYFVHVVTDAMLWGMEREDEAVDYFVARYSRTVRRSRFYEHPTIENFGATPDREIGHDGLIEVKCPTTTRYLEWVIAGVVPEEHKPQMCAQLLCTGKKWVGFMAYDPRIRDENKRLFMRKYEPTQDELERVEIAAVKFLNDLDEMFDRFVTTPAQAA